MFPAAASAMPTSPAIICTDPQLACRLREALCAELGEDAILEEAAHCRHAPLCRWLSPAALGPSGQVQAVLFDAVTTLERTRHAFRSRELGMLRRRLQQLLEELSAPAE